MANLFRDQPKLRLWIGTAATVLIWGLYLARVAFGIGPMRDPQGNQAPAMHYLAGALAVTGIVFAWLLIGATLARRRSEK